MQQDKAGSILQRKVDIELLQRVEEPINKEVQVSGKGVLQEIHSINKAGRFDTGSSVSVREHKAAHKAKELPFTEITQSIGDVIHVLDGGVCSDKEGGKEGVFG